MTSKINSIINAVARCLADGVRLGDGSDSTLRSHIEDHLPEVLKRLFVREAIQGLSGFPLKSLDRADVYELEARAHQLLDDPRTFEGPKIETSPNLAGVRLTVTGEGWSEAIDVQVAEAPAEKRKICWVPFPVADPSNPQLVWELGRDDQVAPEVALKGLYQLESVFWKTLKGQQLAKHSKTFECFLSNASPTGLGRCGIRRHYRQSKELTKGQI
jgi:hypothetical protein